MGQGQNLPVSGEPSITPDPRSNSLIIYASKKDMAQLKKIIEKVDTLLAQVLIEGVIMEVGLTSGFSLGVSASQSPKSFSDNFKSGGAINNTGGNILTNLFPTIPTGGGLTYAMQISSNYNILVSALASDANVNVLQRPRIITSHAVEARFFAGSTIPFVQGSFFGAGTSVGSTYFERQDVGVELNVVPYITKDGLVVMEVSQQIEEIAPNNDGVQTTANAPVTNKRSANSMISVRSGDSVLLGGYIRASKANSNSGVPVLKDIPLLGYLFRSTTIDKARTELMILMRPTVLPTPQDAAELTKDYQQDSPQIRMLEEDFRQERERLNRKAERQMQQDQEDAPSSSRRSVVEPAPEKYQSNPPNQP
jgi:general secretion pathway protein D